MSRSDQNAGLVAQRLELAFGGVQVLKGVTAAFRPGQITGLIGPNGAGKTSFFNCLTGLYQPNSGQVSLGTTVLDGVSASRRAKLGIARTFQHVALCPDLSVVENVIFGLHTARHSNWLDSFLPLPRAWSDREASRDKALQALEIVGLADIAEEPAGKIAPGTLRLVEIARAMVGRPRALLLDEPAAGLNSSETHDLVHMLLRIASPTLAMIVVEHDMDLIMRICNVIHVLNFGTLIASGSPDEIRANPEVTAVYLGAENE